MYMYMYMYMNMLIHLNIYIYVDADAGLHALPHRPVYCMDMSVVRDAHDATQASLVAQIASETTCVQPVASLGL